MSELGQRLISIVREKATANPDFVYKKSINGEGACVYMEDGQPSCIMGHALFDAGLIHPDISASRNVATFRELAFYLDLELDLSEENWLRKVQKLQDSGWRWAKAVERADEVAGINA